MSERVHALEALVAADPEDALGHYLLGQEYLALGRFADAAGALERYCARFDGDKGMACLALAQARAALGDRAGALAALDAGTANATAHRHRQLLEALAGERARIEDLP
jgi:cytochrome c-type biogenesis protein CcmH/NrfG